MTHQHGTGKARSRHHHHDPGQDAVIHWARLYDLQGRIFPRRGRRLRAAIADRLDLRPGQRVLDVACGPGHLAQELARRVTPGGTVDGVDAADEMIARARQNAAKTTTLPLTFETARAQALPFAESSFDAVTCTLALHHIALDDRHSAAAEFLRVLRPGGRVLVADFQQPPGRWARAFVHRAFGHALAERPLEQANELFAEAGFTDLERTDSPTSWIGVVTGTKPS